MIWILPILLFKLLLYLPFPVLHEFFLFHSFHLVYTIPSPVLIQLFLIIVFTYLIFFVLPFTPSFLIPSLSSFSCSIIYLDPTSITILYTSYHLIFSIILYSFLFMFNILSNHCSQLFILIILSSISLSLSISFAIISFISAMFYFIIFNRFNVYTTTTLYLSFIELLYSFFYIFINYIMSISLHYLSF